MAVFANIVALDANHRAFAVDVAHFQRGGAQTRAIGYGYS
jgi:hypothetical protein